MTKSYLVAVLLGTAAMVGSAYAQDVDFSGQTIEFTVPYGPGGGSTLHARIIAQLLEQELPGNPTIIIQNVEGGGSVRGLNQFTQRAQPDGLHIAALGTGSYFQYMLENPNVQYPLPDFIPVLTSPYGLIATGRTDYGLTNDPENNLALLLEGRHTYMGDAATGADMPVLYCFDLLGIELNGVFGVPRNEARMALLRGEGNVNYDNMASWPESIEPYVEDGTLVPLFTFGYLTEEGVVERDQTVPDVPTCMELYEMVHGEPLEGVQREVYDAMFAVRMATAKAIVLPPGTPDDIVRTYQEAMERVVARPELDDPVIQVELGGYPQGTGETAIRLHEQAAVMSDEAKEELQRWLREVWDVVL